MTHSGVKPDEVAIKKELAKLQQIDEAQVTHSGVKPDEVAIKKELAKLQQTDEAQVTHSGLKPDEIAIKKELAALECVANQILSENRPDSEMEANAQSARSKEVFSEDIAALQVRFRPETAGALQFGSDPNELAVDKQWRNLERTVKQLCDAIRERLGGTYGLGVALALTRLEDPRETNAVRDRVGSTLKKRLPPWLEELAATLLIDAGAQTGDGLRTGGVRLDPGEGSDGGYVASVMETGASGPLTLAGLIEQMHLGLAFSNCAWIGFTTLQNAGKDGRWTLKAGEKVNMEFEMNEWERLEAAHQIEHVLSRILDAKTDSRRAPSALEQASMAAEALIAVGPTVRTAAGWPGAGDAPDGRNPDDVARIAVVAEGLRRNVRSTSNRIIAQRMV